MNRTSWAHVKQHSDGRWGVSVYTSRGGVLRCMGTIRSYSSWKQAFHMAHQVISQERWLHG